MLYLIYRYIYLGGDDFSTLSKQLQASSNYPLVGSGTKTTRWLVTSRRHGQSKETCLQNLQINFLMSH